MTRQRALRLLTLDALAGNKLLLDGMQKLHLLAYEASDLLPSNVQVEFRLPRGRQVRLLLGPMHGRSLPGLKLGGSGLRCVVRASSRSRWQKIEAVRPADVWPAVLAQVQAWGGPEGLVELVLAIERARKLVLRELDKATRWL